MRRKVQKNEGVACAMGGRTGTFCKDRAGHALLSDCSTSERSAFIAVPLPFRSDEDRIGGSAIHFQGVLPRKNKERVLVQDVNAAHARP